MIKKSHYMPGQVPRIPGVWGSHISNQSSNEGGIFVSQLYPQEIFLVLISLRVWVDPSFNNGANHFQTLNGLHIDRFCWCKWFSKENRRRHWVTWAWTKHLSYVWLVEALQQTVSVWNTKRCHREDMIHLVTAHTRSFNVC